MQNPPKYTTREGTAMTRIAFAQSAFVQLKDMIFFTGDAIFIHRHQYIHSH